MNYQKIYNNLIHKRTKNVLCDNYEIHHIVPKTLGANDDKSNLVKLSPREHYIAHLLLTKIYPENSGIKIAWQLMACTRDDFSKKKYSSKMYERLKLEVREVQRHFMLGTTKEKCEWRMRSSIKAKKRIGEKHNLWGFHHSDESKKKMSKARRMGGNPKAKPCELEIFRLSTIYECSCLKEAWGVLVNEKYISMTYHSFKSSFRKNNCSKYFDLFSVNLI